ncbi:MAG: PKD domain-containing protein, partial [Sphingobacteriales bacterium]
PAPAKPVASFTVTNGGCTGPCTVTFTNTSQHATTYIWNFGDGTATSALANPTHEYTAAGTYTVTLTASGATESNSTSKTVTIAAPTGPGFYITYKANGASVSLTEVFGERDSLSSERRLIVRGSGPAGAHPTFKFLTTESNIGFVQGLNIGCSDFAFPHSYVTMSNAAGNQYSTEYDEDGIYVFFQEVSYTNGGVIKGKFSGSIKTASGTAMTIEGGEFRVKFIN